MRVKYLIISICIVVVCGLYSPSIGSNSEPENSSQTPDPDQQLKVMVWNIWHRGHFKEYGQKACDETMSILKDSGADVILMVETYGASAAVSAKLGYHYKSITTGVNDNLSIYSRYEITDTYTFSTISNFNFGGVEINIKGKKVRIFNTWLHYLPSCIEVPLEKTAAEIIAWDDAGTRDDEIVKILTAIEPYLDESASIPVIMGGDFNCHSHLDWTEATKDMYNHGGHVIDWTVSNKMADAGFKDSFREMNPCPMKEIGTTWSYSLESIPGEITEATDLNHRFDRIDYIYYQGKNLKVSSSDIHYEKLGETLTLNGKDYFYASDHGFVLTTFDISFDDGCDITGGDIGDE